MKSITLLLLTAHLFAADPNSFEGRKAHVRSLLRHEDFSAARREAQALNRQWLDDVETYQLLAASHLGLGNYLEADQALQWMLDLRLGKADMAGYLLLSRFREVTGDVEGAMEAMHLAFLRLQTGELGDRPRMLAHYARLHIVAGKLSPAAKLLKDASPVAEVQFVQARLYLAQSRPEAAIALLRQLVTENPHPRHLYALAEATKEKADYAAFARAALAVAEASANDNYELALYLAGPGKNPGQALELARRESARRHDIFTQDALAVVLAANGFSAEARRTMQAVLAIGTREPSILAHAAQMGLKPEPE